MIIAEIIAKIERKGYKVVKADVKPHRRWHIKYGSTFVKSMLTAKDLEWWSVGERLPLVSQTLTTSE